MVYHSLSKFLNLTPRKKLFYVHCQTPDESLLILKLLERFTIFLKGLSFEGSFNDCFKTFASLQKTHTASHRNRIARDFVITDYFETPIQYIFSVTL